MTIQYHSNKEKFPAYGVYVLGIPKLPQNFMNVPIYKKQRTV